MNEIERKWRVGMKKNFQTPFKSFIFALSIFYAAIAQ